jgi:hypothetical protein
MVLRERHYRPFGLASVLRSQIEESIAMNQKQQTKRRWIVHRQFEANRLSPGILVQAYAQVVPPHVRVLRLPEGSSEAAQQQFEGPLSKPAESQTVVESAKGSDGAGQTRHSLVIDVITKKEAC